MKIVFEASNRARIKRYAWGITIMDRTLFWSYSLRRWVKTLDGMSGSSHAPCRTYKAFIRHLRKHEAELSGCEVVLVNRYQGHEIRAYL